MVTIAIIGVLVSIAIPAFQNYVVRARVTEGLQLAQVAKTSVSEAIAANNGRIEGELATDYKSPSPTENVSSIKVNHLSGDVEIVFTEKAGGGTMILHPEVKATGEISWNCNEGSLDLKYRPSNCR